MARWKDPFNLRLSALLASVDPAPVSPSSPPTPFHGHSPEKATIRGWHWLQAVVLLGGLLLWVSLLAGVEVGLTIFWDVLIPVTPAILVFGAGIWRNVCPLASLARAAGFIFGTKNKGRLSPDWQRRTQAISVALLFAIIPLRHVIFNKDPVATAVLLAAAGIAAIGMSVRFVGKSGWCAGLCPLLPVEKLYGPRVGYSIPNRRCNGCSGCVQQCPDSSPVLERLISSKRSVRLGADRLVIGGFPGFIVGWFLVSDQSQGDPWWHLFEAYGIPGAGWLLSFTIYSALRRRTEWISERQLAVVFAAASIAAYYWFRIPALLGFGRFPNDGVLIDLSSVLPISIVAGMKVATSLLFIWWLVLRPSTKIERPWSPRPRAA